MKSLNFALLFLLLISFQSFPNSYWQQKVKYFIEVDIDIRNNKFHGKEDLIYYNNSTDTLKNVFFHGCGSDSREKTFPRLGLTSNTMKCRDHLLHVLST